MSKIIFFDIDGTLVGFEGDILASTREALYHHIMEKEAIKKAGLTEIYTDIC